MGLQNKNKALNKTSKMTNPAQEDVVTPSPPNSIGAPPLSQIDADKHSECATDVFSIDYKRLDIEVAMRISPDIQETLADTMTNMFTKIQAEVAHHSQRLDESWLQSWDSTAEQLQSHIQSLLHDNKRLSEKVDDLENISGRNNICIGGLPESIPSADLPALCKNELPDVLGLPTICKVERAHRLSPDLRRHMKDQNASDNRSFNIEPFQHI